MATEYKTTMGRMHWNERATSMEYADDPVPPEGEGWKMVGSAVGELRYSEQPLLWFWERKTETTP
jgi:hypothetical protein